MRSCGVLVDALLEGGLELVLGDDLVTDPGHRPPGLFQEAVRLFAGPFAAAPAEVKIT